MALLAFLAILATAAGAIIYILGLATFASIGYALRGKCDQKKWQARGKYSVMAGVLLSIVGAFYFATHEGDDFHLERFAIVALRDPPKLARVVAKSSSNFGLHSGESCAYSRIEVPQQDYSRLLTSIAADHRFILGTIKHKKVVEGKLVIYEESKILETEEQHEVHRDAGYISEKSSYVRLVSARV